jgi:hypothetical protein
MAEVDARAGFLGLVCEGPDQLAPFDNEVGFAKRDCRSTAVGEQFEAADFVKNTGFRSSAENVADAIGNDKGSFGGFKRLDSFENADREASLREQRRGEQACGGAAYYRNSLLSYVWAGNGIILFWLLALSPNRQAAHA